MDELTNENLNELMPDDGEPPPPILPEMGPIAGTEIAGQLESVVSKEGPGAGVYTREEFFDFFKDCFFEAGDFTGLKSLPIKETETKKAQITANKIYSMAENNPKMRWIIEKELSIWGQWMMIALFVAGKTDDVVEEVTSVSLVKTVTVRIFKWLRLKPRETSDKPQGSGFLARLGLGKRTKPENLSEPATA